MAIRSWTQRGIATGPAPPLDGLDLAGQAISLADYAGKPVMVHFWATWCPTCITESGSINVLAREHAVLTVATDSGQASEIRAFMENRGLKFSVMVDTDGSRARDWGVNAYPTTFFVDARQIIRFAETGFTTEAGLRARLWLTGR